MRPGCRRADRSAHNGLMPQSGRRGRRECRRDAPNEDAIDAFFDLADAIITVRRLIREAWTLYRWDARPAH